MAQGLGDALLINIRRHIVGGGFGVVDRNATDTAQRSYYCKALQKFFAYAEPRLCEMVRAVQMYR